MVDLEQDLSLQLQVFLNSELLNFEPWHALDGIKDFFFRMLCQNHSPEHPLAQSLERNQLKYADLLVLQWDSVHQVFFDRLLQYLAKGFGIQNSQLHSSICHNARTPLFLKQQTPFSEVVMLRDRPYFFVILYDIHFPFFYNKKGIPNFVLRHNLLFILKLFQVEWIVQLQHFGLA